MSNQDRTPPKQLGWLEVLDAVVPSVVEEIEARRGELSRELGAWERAVGQRDVQTIAGEAVLLGLAQELQGVEEPDGVLPSCTALGRSRLSRGLIQAARAQCREDIQMLGPAYEHLVGRDKRYALGQYFTPAPLARHMASHLREIGCETVLDPAVGAGVLLAATAEALGGVQLLGGDVNPVCVQLARAGLHARGVPHEAFQVKRSDFLASASTGADLNMSARKKRLEPVDAIICNPPYMRHHLIDKEAKKALSSGYSDRFGVKVSSLSTSYVYFFLEALERLKDDGVMVFITPADYLDVTYGQPLKELFSRRFTLDTLELFKLDELAFEGVLTTSTITVVRKRPAASGHQTLIREAKATTTEIIQESEREAVLSEVDIVTNWTLQSESLHRAHQTLIRGRERTLGDYIRTRRGIATGANAFFVLTQDKVDAWGIEERFLKPVLASARDLPDGVLTREHWDGLREAGRPVWLLDCGLSEGDVEGLNVARYLEYGRREGVHERFNCRTRSPWYRVEQVKPPDVIVTYMNRGKTRFVKNEADCRVMSVFLNGFITDPEVDVEGLLEVLNDDITSALITQIGRTYGGGLGKIEPRELLRLPMPELQVVKDRPSRP